MILSKIFLGDFCLVMKFTSYRSTCTAKGPKPLRLKFSSLFKEYFPILCVKTGEVEVNRYRKKVQ